MLYFSHEDATGAAEVPPIGLIPQPSIMFQDISPYLPHSKYLHYWPKAPIDTIYDVVCHH